MSDDAVGLVFLGAAFAFSILGYLIAREGLKDVKDSSDKVQQTVAEAQGAVAAAQQVVAEQTGPDVRAVAASGVKVAEKTMAIQESVGGMQDALAGMTGRLAPARFLFAAGATCLLASLFAFDIISIDLAGGADSSTGAEEAGS